ncbi:hypothetical protein TUM17563_04190 [Klebsiella oxytoca]|nr:hypothetical protein TUM17563_04190 [Klebsiella oxytoca]
MDALRGEKAAKASKGSELSNPTAVILSPKSWRIDSKTGAIAVKGTRRLMAIKRMPVTSMIEDHLFVMWDINFAFSGKKKDFKERMSYRI